MTWIIILAGFTIACLGSAGAASLVTTARRVLAQVISRRLRGGDDSLAWLPKTEREVAAAIAATSFGVALVGAAIPGLFSTATLPTLGILVVLIVVPTTLVGAHLLPRWVTLTRADEVVKVLQPLLTAWGALLGAVLPSRTEDAADDVRSLAREGRVTGLEGDELVMVGGVMSFAERPVRAVMTPRTDMVAVPHDASYQMVMEVFAESAYTRVPVYRNTLDEIVGMIHVFDLFQLRPDDALPVRPVSFAPESRAAGDLLIDMQRERRHLAVVLDEFGGTAGIVTLEDLLEALVGEIADEDEAPAAASPVSAELLEIDGAAAPSVVGEHFNVTLPRGEAASFGGLLAELAGRIPAVGARFTLAGLDIEVLQASPTRIERVLVQRTGTPVTVLDRARE
jgi:CBS domain containing-hemolysin-like protein